MNFLLVNFIIALWVTAITTSGIGIFVYWKNPGEKLNRIFAYYSWSISWWSFCQIWLIACDEKITSLIWTRIEQVGVFFIPTFFVHFVVIFLKLKNRGLLLRVCYGFSIFFAMLCPTRYMMADAVPKFYVKHFAIPGAAYPFAVLFFAIIICYGLYELFKEYLRSTGSRKNQLKYLVWSSLIGYIGGGANFALVFGINIPILNPFGTYALPIYVAVTTYAVIRYRLMDINVAITRAAIFTFVYALVLGIPFGLVAVGRYWLMDIFGEQWFWVPMFILLGLATIGPYFYLYLKGRAENVMLKDQRRYQGALRELSKSMSRIRNLNELINEIVLSIVDTVKVKFTAIYLKNDEYKTYKLKQVYPKANKIHFQEIISRDHSLIKFLCEQKRPVLSEEIGHLQKFNSDADLLIPCFIEDELLAFLVLGSKPKNEIYTNDDLLIFETLSYSTALAIENCFFWKEIHDKQRSERIKEMDIFSYSLAHEIDNPMQVILGNMEMFREDFGGDKSIDPARVNEIRKGIEHVHEAAERVSNMVKAIEDFGKISTGELAPVKIIDVIEGFSQLYLPQFKAHGVRFVKELSSEINLICVLGEKPELMQILVILANNAIHAMQDLKDKRITLKTDSSNQDLIKVSMKDNGYGIKKEILPILFAPFTTTKASTEGTGMGLYNAKKIIQRHKGKIWAESEGEGKGASFFIELPIAKGVKEEDIKKRVRGKSAF